MASSRAVLDVASFFELDLENSELGKYAELYSTHIVL